MPDNSLPATTTKQEDYTTAGQRRINLIWEVTQAIIAFSVVGANIVIWVGSSFGGRQSVVPEGLTNALFLIVGFYFSRTNHQAIGGIGPKPEQKYDGR